jgi:hypothetical protein
VVNQKPVLNYPVESITKLYRNDSTNGNWIKIALKGTDGELNGLGSRVEVVIGKVKMIREIDGGSSHLSQNSTIAHFGLGNASVVDSVIVKWIGGKEQTLTDQPINTLLTIIETKNHKRYSWVIVLTPILIILIILIILNSSRVKRMWS